MEDYKRIADLVQPVPRRHGYRVVACRRKPEVSFARHVPRHPETLPDQLWRFYHGLCDGKLPWPLFIHGPTGAGKTVAGYCFRDITPGCAWCEVGKLIDQLLGRTYGWWEAAADRSCFIVDEVGGSDSVASVEYNALKRFLDIRERFRDRVAVYLSNHSPDRIRELYDDRTASRLLCGTIYHLNGPDRRKSQ